MSMSEHEYPDEDFLEKYPDGVEMSCADYQALMAFVAQVAGLTKDGEETEDHPEGYDMASDDAVDTLAELINAARALMLNG
jgi:hypothetical protein